MRFISTVAAVAALAIAVSGCAPSMSGGAYTREQARREQSVRLGVVKACARCRSRARAAELDRRPVRSWAGSPAALSAKQSSAWRRARGVAGGVAGQAAEEVGRARPARNHGQARRRQAGRHHPGGGRGVQAGERVRIISDGTTSRVTH